MMREIDQISYRAAGNSHIIKKLGFMFPRQLIHGFDFHNNSLKYAKVGHVAFPQLELLIKHTQILLHTIGNPLKLQLNFQALLIDFLQQPASQLIVNFKGRPHQPVPFSMKRTFLHQEILESIRSFFKPVRPAKPKLRRPFPSYQRKLAKISGFLFFLILSSAVFAADEQDSVEQKLREALRNTMLQLRDAQGQVATLQAAQVENEQKLKDLDTKFKTLTRQAANDKSSADKTIGELSVKVSAQDEEISRLKISLDKWKEGYDTAAALARDKEAQRTKLANDLILLQRKVEDQQRKNDAMFRLGNEILTRYERFGLGDALAAREPFVGVTRVKFQNLIQNYQDKIVEQKIQP